MMWLDHLHTIKENRKRGAAKAAETRRRKKENPTHTVVISPKEQDRNYYCAVCNQEYQEFTVSVENWIGYDSCERWFHFTCVGILEVPDEFLCDECM